MVIEGFWVRARNDGGMAFFPKEKWPKIDFFLVQGVPKKMLLSDFDVITPSAA